MWLFGKKKKDSHHEHAGEVNGSQPKNQANPESDVSSDSSQDVVPGPTGDTPADAAAASAPDFQGGVEATTDDPTDDDTAGSVVDDAADAVDATATVIAKPHDAIGGAAGPFDGDNVDIETFDFSDFSAGVLNLGSMKINLPKESQVQVEMGENGPKMLHIVTRYGRMTPVAFAAPRSQGLWAEAGKELVEGINNDGLPARLEDGPWGSEVVGENSNGQIRIIGIDGPRWMLRLTLAAPKGREEELAELGREVAARTFIYRGDDPVLAGNALQVVLPPQLVEQLKQAMEQRKQQVEQAKKQATTNSPRPQTPRTPAEEEALQHLHELQDNKDDNPDNSTGESGQGADQDGDR